MSRPTKWPGRKPKPPKLVAMKALSGETDASLENEILAMLVEEQ